MTDDASQAPGPDETTSAPSVADATASSPWSSRATTPVPSAAIPPSSPEPTPVVDAPVATKTKADKPPRSFLVELPVLVAIAVVLALILKAFVVQAFFIPSASMEETLHIKDRVLVSKLSYDFHSPRRGDIVVFNGKHTNFPDEVTITPPSNPIQSAAQKIERFLGLGAPDESDFIKRVIAVGGDTVQCCTDGEVVVNGKPLSESYVDFDNPGGPGQGTEQTFCLGGPNPQQVPLRDDPACSLPTAKPFVVPKDTLFVMGDHRTDSTDSRYEGVIPVSSVVGRAFIRIWPLDRLHWFTRPSNFSHL